MAIEKDTIPELSIELLEDKQGSLILLEQDCGGNVDRICIHPIQVRYIVEKFGLAETSDLQSAKTIAALKRRLEAIRSRVEYLHDYLCNHSDHKHADLTYELTYATATLELADEYCADLEDAPAVSTEGTK